MSTIDAGPKAGMIKYNRTVGMTTMEGRGFYCPTDTAIGENGRLYVVSRSTGISDRSIRVTVCDLEGEYYGTFGFHGEGDGQFIWPSCGAVDSQGRVYISDEHTNLISNFDAYGSFLGRWGTSGDGEGELDAPSGLAFDKEDDLYVSDTQNNRVQKFTNDGRLLAFGSKGDGDGQLNLPWGLTVAPGGDVYVADWGNDRIHRFSGEGNYVAKYGTSGRGHGQFHRPSGVAVDAEGYMYVADWGNERIQVLDPEGGYVMENRGESTLSKWAENFLQANVEEAEARARANLEPEMEYFNDDPHEESSHIEKYFWSPVSIKMDEAGRLYVTEGNRHRIQVYEPAS